VGKLQALCAVQLGQVPVKRAQGKMTRLSSHLEHQAVGQADCGPGPVLLQSGGDGLGILNGQVPVVQQLPGRP
jgi:hypothetical protein